MASGGHDRLAKFHDYRFRHLSNTEINTAKVSDTAMLMLFI
jgi:hypothetical protein